MMLRSLVFATTLTVVFSTASVVMAQEDDFSLDDSAFESVYNECLEAADKADDFDTTFSSCMEKHGYTTHESEDDMTAEEDLSSDDDENEETSSDE